MAITQKVVDALAERTPGFDDTWYNVLKKWFVYSHLPSDEQHALITKAGQQTSVIVGFDIYSRISDAQQLPVMGKVYFPPCYVAADKGITRWQAVRQAINQLPDVKSYPNILQSTEMINDYLSDKPEAWQMGTRYLATDLVVPSKARFKVYMRCFGTSFDEIWDYYTLGGRIPDLDDDKQKFRDLMDMVSGTTYAETRSKDQMELPRFVSATQKLTAIYFAISAENPYPAPKLCVYPSNFAPDDGVIARGLDSWLSKYGWSDGEKSMEERVKSVLYVLLPTVVISFTLLINGDEQHAPSAGGEDGHLHIHRNRKERRSYQEGSEYPGVCDSGTVPDTALLGSWSGGLEASSDSPSAHCGHVFHVCLD